MTFAEPVAMTPLRYATHLGFRSHELPLFPHAVGNLDPAAHIEFAARLGFVGALYPWALSRPEPEVESVVQALKSTGLECGCVVYGPRELLSTPLWGEPGRATRSTILAHIQHASMMAGRLGSRTLAVLAAASPDRPIPAQRETMAGHLRAAAKVASSYGLVIGIEPMIVLPNMLLKNCAEALELIHLTDSPAVKVIFDTAHAEMMGDPVVQAFDRLYDSTCVLQLADQPGRVEPGAGTVDIVSVLEIAMRRGFSGLVELEHFWSEPGLAGEQSGLTRVRVADATARARIAWNQARRTAQ
jgi:hydroxypyruvate isomerase